MTSRRFLSLVLAIVCGGTLTLTLWTRWRSHEATDDRDAASERADQLLSTRIPPQAVGGVSNDEESTSAAPSQPAALKTVATHQLLPGSAEDKSANLEDLAARLSRGSVEDRETAARALIADGSPESVAQYLAVLQAEPDLYAVERLVRTLQGLDNPAAWSALAPFLTNSQNHVILSETQNALARIGSEESVIALLAMLQTDLNDWQLQNVLAALARTRTEAAVAPMLEAALATTDDHYLEVVAPVLSAIGTPEAIFGLAQLIEVRGFTNPINPLSDALAQTRSYAAIPALMTLLTTSPNALVKNASAQALAYAQQQLGGIGLDALLRMYSTSDSQAGQ